MKIIVCFLAAVLLTSAARADADSDRIGREAARAAAEAAAREAFRSWADAQTKGAKIGTGTAILAGVDLALASYDFANAKTDKQRFYSGLRAGAAVYVLSSGPYAPVVALAVTAAIIVEAGFASRHAAALLEIYRQVEDAERKYIEVQKTLVRADAIAFDTILSMMQTFVAATGEAEKALKNYCSASTIKDVAQLDTCTFWISSYYANAENFVSAANQLLAWKSDNISFEQAFRAAKLATDELRAAKTGFEDVLKKSATIRADFFRAYNEMHWNLIQQKVLDSPVFSVDQYLLYNCVDASADLVRSGQKILLQVLPNVSPYTELEKGAVLVRADAVIRAMEAFGQSPCVAFSRRDRQEEHRLLRDWIQHLAETRKLLEQTVGKLR